VLIKAPIFIFAFLINAAILYIFLGFIFVLIFGYQINSNIIALVLSLVGICFAIFIYWAGCAKNLILHIKSYGLQNTISALVNEFKEYTSDKEFGLKIEYKSDFLEESDKPNLIDEQLKLTDKFKINLNRLVNYYESTFTRGRDSQNIIGIFSFIIFLCDFFWDLFSFEEITIYLISPTIYIIHDHPGIIKLIFWFFIGISIVFISKIFVTQFRKKIFKKLHSIVCQLYTTGNFVLLHSQYPGSGVELIVMSHCAWNAKELMIKNENGDIVFIEYKDDKFWSYAIPIFINFDKFNNAFNCFRDSDWVEKNLFFKE